MNILVLGGGLSGCCIAYLLSKQGHNVKMIEREDEVGGLCRTRSMDDICYEFGPHICYAKNETPAYELFHRLLPEFKYIKYFPKQSMDGELNNLATFPITVANVFNLPKEEQVKAVNELYQVNLDRPDYTNFERYIISRVGKTMYEHCYKNYNRKQWGIEPKDMDAEWARFRNFYLRPGDYGMFGDMWQGHPVSYSNFFNKLIEGIEVIRDTVVEVIYERSSVKIVKGRENEYTADFVISTLPIDALLNNKDLLEYRGITKLFYELEGDSGLPTYLCTFPNHYSWTRITDYKLQAEQQTKNTIISFAYPYSSKASDLPVDDWKKEAETFITDKLGKRILNSECESHRYVYPISTKDQLDQYKKLIKKAASVKNLISFGRLGLYSYISMCTAVNQASHVANTIDDFLDMQLDNRQAWYQKLREELS